jgi:hypothetical protein
MSAEVTLPLIIWDIRLPLNVLFRSWRHMRVLFSPNRNRNHISQGRRHRAKGCVALGWNLAIVMTDPLRALGSTPLYTCALGGDHLNSH